MNAPMNASVGKTTITRRYSWGKLQVRANFGKSEGVVEYRVDGDEWRIAPGCVAEYGHTAARALRAVNTWLKGQA